MQASCCPLASHFSLIGSGYALTLLGVAISSDGKGASYLLLDPHYSGADDDAQHIAGSRWCRWLDASEAFPAAAFFNFCLPLLSERGETCTKGPPSDGEATAADAAADADWLKLMTVTDG